MLPTLDLMDEISDIIFVIFITPVTIEVVNIVVGLLLVFLHRLHGVEVLITPFKRAADLTGGHDDGDDERVCLVGNGQFAQS